MSEVGWFCPEWPAPANVGSLITTRSGGVSRGCFASLNLGDHVGDDAGDVAVNRQRLVDAVGGRPFWLEQVHGTRVVDLGGLDSGVAARVSADAAVSRRHGLACTVMTADCLPVLLCDDEGRVVAAAHAGWRGLLAGVLESAVGAMAVPGERVMAYLGPAIGPAAFEVGDEVRTAFVERNAQAAYAFQAAKPGKWLADIYALARQRLSAVGVSRVFGGTCCTFSEPERFFSFRRDGQTGRMASLIWLEKKERP